MKGFSKDYNQKLMKANWLQSFGVWSTLGQGLNCQRLWRDQRRPGAVCMCVCVCQLLGAEQKHRTGGQQDYRWLALCWLLANCKMRQYKDSLESWLRPKKHARIAAKRLPEHKMRSKIWGARFKCTRNTFGLLLKAGLSWHSQCCQADIIVQLLFSLNRN